MDQIHAVCHRLGRRDVRVFSGQSERRDGRLATRAVFKPSEHRRDGGLVGTGDDELHKLVDLIHQLGVVVEQLGDGIRGFNAMYHHVLAHHDQRVAKSSLHDTGDDLVFREEFRCFCSIESHHRSHVSDGLAELRHVNSVGEATGGEELHRLVRGQIELLSHVADGLAKVRKVDPVGEAIGGEELRHLVGGQIKLCANLVKGCPKCIITNARTETI